MAGRDAFDIVLCTPNMKDGGTQRTISLLANAWSRRGLRVAIVTLSRAPSVYPLDPAVRNIWVERLGARFRSRWKKLVAPLRSRSGGPDAAAASARAGGHGLIDEAVQRARKLLHVADYAWQLRRTLQEAGAPVVVAFIADVNVWTILASTGQTWRVVICEQNDPGRQHLPYPWQGLRQRLYGRADLVTANSQNALQTMSAYVPSAKLAFLPNPLVIPDPSCVPPVAERRPHFLAVGRLHPQKAYDDLLRAFALLPEALRAWQLIVLGRGDLLESLSGLAQSLGVADRVQWCGQVTDPNPYYAVASVFVQPSRHEGMSNALLEAMSFGLAPIISDTSGGGLEVVTHGETGLVVPFGDISQLTEAMTRVALDADLRMRLGEAARTRLAEFDLPHALAVWEAALGLESTTLSGQP